MQQQDECIQSDNAGAALYKRYAVSIFAYARLHTSSWEDAEDLVLEVFTAALEQKSLSWLAEKQQLVWLRRVAQNKLVDRYRRSLHFSLLPLEQLVETVLTEEVLTPEQVVVRREELEQLYSAVGKLPPLQQQVLQLRLGDGLRFAEIAVLLDKREAAVRKLYSRTLALLRTIYAQH
ncbi:MAG TPA: sigma-70 family RNA polymerase sigma factor [Ktedonobacteraceae bacterium]